MTHTYDVRVWSIDVYKGTRTTSYIVRWKVGDRRWKDRFPTRALADSFRAELLTATRKGEGFDTTTGRPVSTTRPGQELRWMPFARDYIDMKWPAAAATYRRSLSEALTGVTVAMLDSDRDRPDPKVLRAALHRWAFNTARRDASAGPEVRAALRWAEGASPPAARLADPAVLRRVLNSISVRLDGTPGAASVVGKRRRVLFNIAEYAVERKCIDSNPVPTVK